MKLLGLMSALLWLGAAMAGGAETWQKSGGAKEGGGAGPWLRLVWLPPAGDELQVGDKRSGAGALREKKGGDGESFPCAHGAGRERFALAGAMGARVFPGTVEHLLLERASVLVASLYPERGPPACLLG